MRVLVECYHDVALMRSPGIPIRQVRHEHGKGNILRLLARWDGEATGIVDADPGKLRSNPREMEKYARRDEAQGLKLMEHRDDPRKRLVVIAPTLEEWLLARARACSLQRDDYGLPESAGVMHRTPRYDRKPAFHSFLGELTAKDGAMMTFKEWLNA